MRKDPRIYLVIALALALSALIGCGTPLATQYAKVRYVNFKVYDPVYVGIERGFFKERGVEVEIVGDVLAGPTAIQAVAGGSAEAGLSSIPALINANASGLPVLGVTDIQSAIGQQALEEFFVRADSNIKTIADLRGKTVAVNLWRSSFHYTVLMALEKAGIPEKEVKFVLLPFDKQELALEQRQVDLIGLMEPYASHAKTVYGERFSRLFTALDVFGEKQFCVHFVNKVWARYNPDQVRAFASGIADSIAWIEKNQEQARQIIAKRTGVEEKYVPDYHFQPNGKVVDADVLFWLDYMRRMGDLTADWLKAEDIATNGFNVRARP